MAFTFFMRDQPTLEHAADHMIPYASGRSRIKIWDAGSALGQDYRLIPQECSSPFSVSGVGRGLQNVSPGPGAWCFLANENPPVTSEKEGGKSHKNQL
jgi:hypothetical protein